MSDLISEMGLASKLVMKIVLAFIITYALVSAIHIFPIKGLALAVAVGCCGGLVDRTHRVPRKVTAP